MKNRQTTLRDRQTTTAKDRESAGLMMRMLMPGGLQQLTEDIAAAEAEISDAYIDDLYRAHDSKERRC